MAAGPPQAPQEAPAAAPAPGPQAAVNPPHDQGPPLGPSPGGPWFAPVREATAIVEGIHRAADPPSAGVHTATAPQRPFSSYRCRAPKRCP